MGLFNFVFNIAASRVLGQEQYGMVYPLISLLMIINLPVGALQMVLSKDFSELIHHKKWDELKVYFAGLFKALIGFTLLLLLILFFLFPFLKSFLHIGQSLPFFLLFGLVILSILYTPFYSMIQSREKYGIYSLNSFAMVLVKFIAGIGLVLLTTSYLGVLWGLLCSQLAGLIILFTNYQSFKEVKKAVIQTKNKNQYFQSRRIWKSFFYAIISVGAFQLITYLDSVLVRHFLPDSAGIYSVVNLIGKASFYLATAVAFVMLPFLAKDKENLHHANRRAFFFLLGLLFAYAVLLLFASKPIAQYLFAGKYSGMENILPLYGFMFLPYAAVSYLVNYYFLSEKTLYSLTILGGVIIESIGIAFFHQDLIQVSLVVGVSGYIVLLLLMIDSIFLHSNSLKPKISSTTSL
jgi:O-antigen/teichoic acid export membrane protein